ncbi:uncharacterized protein ATC70_006167 [Mucor velutinosus]|uniref:Uncharacterized protein n=1 Tax=Mucor velutinosus TaxID=708070 RepID=A0AAN7D4L4_9FUNG|nr:hypothetical protein ATC70_006167 [Mucor velutinosus]
MESTSIDGIASYYPAIESAIESVSGGKLSLAGVIDKLHIDIVNLFNGECISKYKRDWVRSVMAFAKNKDIDMPTTPKPNWEDIYGTVIDRMLNKGYNFQKFQKPISCKISQASQSSSSTATACTDSSSTSTSTNTESGSESAGVDPQRVKLPALTAADRANILERYNALDPKKMWRLSNGTVVEERMCKCAMEQQHEHMAHSFILDAKDEGWLKYFTRSELNEISAYKAIQLPEAPEEVVNYLNTLKSDTAEDLTDKVEHQKLPLNSDRKWIQDSYSQCIRLINSGFLPSDKNTTEAGLIKRVWSCIDACFDYSSKIRCISGEKCSKSSADAKNATRWDIKCR